MTFENAKEKLEKYGQAHLLKYYDELSEEDKKDLLEQIEVTDFSVLTAKAFENEDNKITPIKALTVAEIEKEKEEDKQIAATIFNFGPSEIASTVYNSSTTKIVAGTAGENEVNILDLIDSVVEVFNENDVPDGEKIVSEGSPRWWRTLKAALRGIDTDNSAILRHRKCPTYNDVYLFKTNNAKIAGVEYVSFRTLSAVAFFDPFMKMVPYTKEKGFCDCLKGFQIFDCAIIKEKEVKWLKPKWN